MRAIDYALIQAQSQHATLVVLSLIQQQQGKAIRLEHIQQSKDFLEAVHYKAAKSRVAIERIEMYTQDTVKSIQIVAQEMECSGILLFARRGTGVLLNVDEIRHVMMRAHSSLYFMLLVSPPNKVSRWFLRHFQRHQEPSIQQQNIPENDALIQHTPGAAYFLADEQEPVLHDLQPS
jgi:hypothetical protein